MTPPTWQAADPRAVTTRVPNILHGEATTRTTIREDAHAGALNQQMILDQLAQSTLEIQGAM